MHEANYFFKDMVNIVLRTFKYVSKAICETGFNNLIFINKIISREEVVDLSIHEISNKRDEINKYNKSKVIADTGEINDWDEFIFQFIIRKKIIKIIKFEVTKYDPDLILDYGCGGGWVSILLSGLGYPIIGMDISVKILKNAKNACKDGNFFACDAELLPLRKEILDYVIGISILHHLKLSICIDEIKRVTKNNSHFFFEEPNLLNPFSAFGRKFFPMETHTVGEKPFYLSHLTRQLEQKKLTIKEISYLFLLAFPLSRFFKLFRTKIPIKLIYFYYYFETIFEKIPLLNRLNASIILIGLLKK